MQFYSLPKFMAGLLLVAMVSCESELSVSEALTAYDSSTFNANIEASKPYLEAYDDVKSHLGNASTVIDHAPDFEARINTIKSRVIGGYQQILDKHVADYSKFNQTLLNSEDFRKGGRMESMVMNEEGLDISASISNGLLGAFNYYQASKLLSNSIALKDIDVVRAMFGNFSTVGNEQNYKYIAQIMAVLDKKTGTKYVDEVNANLLKLQNAVSFGSTQVNEKSLAIDNIKYAWEKGNMALVMRHMLGMKKNLEQLSSSPDSKMYFIRDYSEATGLLIGWRAILSAHKSISDVEMKNIMTLMLMTERTTDPVTMLNQPTSAINNINKALDILNSVYNFSEAERSL